MDLEFEFARARYERSVEVEKSLRRQVKEAKKYTQECAFALAKLYQNRNPA